MLPLKDLRGRGVGEKVTGWDGKILEELEGLPGGRASFGCAFLPTGLRRRKDCADYTKDYIILVQLVKDDL